MKTYKQICIERARQSKKAKAVEGDELKQLQKVLFDIFTDVQQVCNKHNLNYVLFSGTALGAVRHKGFIPWDDDLDIAMPRNDFERFKKIFKKELGDRYTLNSPNYDGRPTNRFAKVLKNGTKFVEFEEEDDDRACIKIDIFVIENLPNNTLIRLLKGICCTFLMFAGAYVLSYETSKAINKKKGLREWIGMLFSFRSSEKWFDKYDVFVRSKNKRSKYVGIPSGREHFFKGMFRREIFFPVSEGEFEGTKVKLPARPDLYLTHIFGDYMTIPSEEKREKHYIEYLRF